MYKSYANALDELLRFYEKETEDIAAWKYINSDIGQGKRTDNELKRIGDKYNCSWAEQQTLKQYLLDNNLIEIYPENIIITFKGRDWIKQGGYTKERRNKKTGSFVNFASSVFLIGGAIATISIAFFEGYKFFEKPAVSIHKERSNQIFGKGADTLKQHQKTP